MSFENLLPKDSVILTLKDKHREVTISVPSAGLTGTEFVEELVKPLMLCMGYQEDTVNDALGIDENI